MKGTEIEQLLVGVDDTYNPRDVIVDVIESLSHVDSIDFSALSSKPLVDLNVTDGYYLSILEIDLKFFLGNYPKLKKFYIEKLLEKDNVEYKRILLYKSLYSDTSLDSILNLTQHYKGVFILKNLSNYFGLTEDDIKQLVIDKVMKINSMETIKEAVTELGDIRKSINNYKSIKNSIKKTITEGLDEMIRFLMVGPGVVSPEATRTRCNKVMDLIKIWYKKPEDRDCIEKILDIKRKFITPSLTAGDSEEKSISQREEEIVTRSKELEEKIPADLREKYLPMYIERLRPETIERGDVAFLPIGPILHYCIVFKVVGEISFVLSITTSGEAKGFVGYQLERSRFFKGTALYTLHQVPTALVNRKFVMPYDNKAELGRIFTGCEEYLKTNVLKRTYNKRKKK